MNLLASLRNRVFMASVVLAAVTLGFAIYLISVRVSQQAEVELARGLQDAAGLLEEQHAALSELFLLRARLVADLPVLKSAVDTEDPQTVRPLASDYQRQLRADVLVVTDREGHVLYGPTDVGAPQDRDSVQRALAGLESAAFWPHRRGVLQVVTVPIALGRDVPDILGTLSAGFLLDDRRAEEFKRLTASEVAFAIGGAVHAATLPLEARAALAPAVRSDRGVSHVLIQDDEYVVSGVPLSLPVPVPGAEPPPIALVLRSRAHELRALQTIQSSVLAAAGLAVALAIALSYVVARSVTTPLGTITAEMRDMARTGDLTRKIRLRGPPWSQDEDAQLLASTFNTLTDSIARFQREEAQRERLLSLGRLSTVIAHEIRNPLMIIKAALQPMRSASAPDVRDAAADIDEQVERLNRIVHDVLDFARPLRFDLAPADLAVLCREAAAAAAPNDALPPVRVDVPPLQIVTDGERLRSALINVLANARQATAARKDGAEHAGTPVELTARRTSSGGFRIAVRDRGIGISPEHLPHVFEPYFTTRRTGTGLGLPIARNIIEGLGGSISVRAADPGTIVEIEFPASAVPAGPTKRRTHEGDGIHSAGRR
ncbi:MAG TPA: ATP-binding protein [Vicinamibacterales bacterium]|nr:ATP-binding protein [Vicinamibacterales bacterium]